MHTPSLGRRFVAAGVGTVVVLVLALDALVYFSLRSSLMGIVDRALDAQESMARADNLSSGPAALADRLGQQGIRATVRAPDGSNYRSHVQGPAVQAAGGQRLVSRRFDLAGGVDVTVFTPDEGMASKLRHVAVVELAGTPLLVLLALLLLRWVAEVALEPLDRIAAAARRTAAGRRGERLRPDHTDTRLGQLAVAYDGMLDALEAAVADAQAAQADSERLQAHTREIIETAREAFVAMGPSGEISDWNAEAERIFGWPRDEVIGHPLAQTIIPPEFREAHREGIERFRQTGGGPFLGGTVEVTAMRRGGGRFPAELTVWATGSGGDHSFNAFLRDVSGRIEAQRAMSQLAAIVESSDEAILSTDLEGIIITWNGGAERMYGYTAAEAVGKPLSDLTLPPGNEAQVQRALGAVRRGQAVQRLEVTRRHKSGALLDVGLTISPVLDASGHVYGASSVGRDITEERWIASKLDATLAALELALEEARESEAGTRRFLDDAAHQLRAPITSILACAETLLRGTTADERDRLLTAVVRQSFRASRLMAGLLRMARLNQGLPPEPRPTDLVTLCEQEAERARGESPDLELVVTTGARPVGHPTVDPSAVAEIVSNLLDNARRHAWHLIRVVVVRTEDGVQIEVHDDGPGLPEGMEERAFERFVSFDAKGGSGLGLPIARELARASGGDLAYQGDAFVLWLPLLPGRSAGLGAVGPEGPTEAGDDAGAHALSSDRP